MGDRAQVNVVRSREEEEDTDFTWLYTHWRGHRLRETVAAALAREARWSDGEYLARMIFQEMVGDDTGSTGYGIGCAQHSDVYRVVRVDVAEQEVILEGWGEDGNQYRNPDKETLTFEEFIEEYAPEEAEPDETDSEFQEMNL